jgi:hypothetical protein
MIDISQWVCITLSEFWYRPWGGGPGWGGKVQRSNLTEWLAQNIEFPDKWNRDWLLNRCPDKWIIRISEVQIISEAPLYWQVTYQMEQKYININFQVQGLITYPDYSLIRFIFISGLFTYPDTYLRSWDRVYKI